MRYSLLGFFCFLVLTQSVAQSGEIIYPKEGQYISNSITFKWNKDLNADSYKFLLGKDMQLSDTLLDTDQTSLTYMPIMNGTYYWKVFSYSGTILIDSSSLGIFQYFDPTSIDSLNLWLKADNGLLLVGNKLTSWQDQSDSALLLTQSITSRQPELIDSVLNNYPAIRFDSTDDEILAPVRLLGPNYTVSAVYNVREKKNRGIRLFDGTNNWLMGPHVSAYRTFNGGFSAGKPIIQYQYVTHTAYVNNDTLNNYVNGIKYGERAENFPPGQSVLISGNGLNGDLLEVIVSSGYIEDSVRAYIDNYLMDKYSPPINLGEDRIVCSFPDSITINADYALDFLWSTGDTTEKAIIDSAGYYYLTITDQFERTSVDSVLFILDTSDFQLNFGFEDTTICNGEQIELNAGNDRFSYMWSSGETTNTVQLDSAGLYYLDLTNCLSNTSRDSFYLHVNEPVFSLGPDTTICFNESYILQADSNFTNVTYLWMNGNTGAVQLADTTQDYILRVTDNYNCSFTDTVSIIQDSSLYGLSLGPDTSLCEGNTLSLYGDTSNVMNYLWGSGNTTAYERVDTAGTYILSVNNSQCSFSDTVQVSIQGLAPTAIFGSESFCFGDSVSFTDSSTAPAVDTIVSYFWDFDGLGTSNQRNPLFSFPDTGLFQVQLTITTDKGCAEVVTNTVDIQSLPKPDFTSMGNCSKRPLQLTSVSTIDEGSIQSYFWDFDDGNTSTQTNPIHFFDTLGDYQVMLIATSDQGCIDTIVKSVMVDPSPAPSFVFENQCLGDSTYFRSTTTLPSGSITEYLWFANGQQINDSIATVKFNSVGEQQVILRVNTDKNCLQLVRDTIEIYPKPSADFIVEDICEGEDFTIIDNSSASQDQITRYFYTFSSSILIDTSSLANPIFNPTGVGEYSIKLLVETNNSCLDSTEKLVNVKPLPTANFRIVNNNSGAPYTLEVENTSLDADQYIWSSGKGESSTDLLPNFVYPDTGSYDVQLIAISSASCRDTISKSLNVLSYFLDASIEDAQLIEDLDNSYKIRLRISNNGTNKINDMEILIEAENQLNLAEKVDKEIYKGNTLIHTLNSFLPANGDNASFICFNIHKVNGVKDDVASNNKVCVSAFPNKLYLAAYPNPVQDWLNVDFVLLNSGRLTLKLYDMIGKEVNDELNDVFLEEGFHQERINLSPLRSGNYILRFSFEGIEEEIKIVRQ